MKVVVIGGSGLIGARLVSILRNEDHEVVAASPRSGVNTLTCEGLEEALAGAEVVVDVSNSPSFEETEVMNFFTTSTRTLLKYEHEAGVRQHVVLSVVGTDRLQESAYFRAKLAQEEQVKAASVPFTIVRATQFYEFIGGIADASTVENVVRVHRALFQPMSAEDVNAILGTIATGEPINDTIEVAGPKPFPIQELVSKVLEKNGDTREVVADSDAVYFGAKLDELTLVPCTDARLGETSFEEWLDRSFARAKGTA